MTYSITLNRLFSLFAAVLLICLGIQAQSSRPRRVKQQPAKPAEDSLLRPEPTPSPTARRAANAPLLDVQPVTPVGPAAPTANTKYGGASRDTARNTNCQQNNLPPRRAKQLTSYEMIQRGEDRRFAD
jgi:hypothetical protein